MKTKTMNLSLSWAETKVEPDGSLVQEIGCITPGGDSVKIRLKLNGVGTLGYMADDLHSTVKKLQAALDDAKTRLQGDH